MGDQEAITKFCSAQRELEQIRESTWAEQKRLSRSSSCFKDTLKQNMERQSLTCARVTVDGKEAYVKLQPRRKNPKVETRLLIDAIERMEYTPSQKLQPLGEFLEDLVKHHVEMLKTTLSDQTKTYVSVSYKTPKEGTIQNPHPSIQNTLTEIVRSLDTTAKQSKELRARDDVRKKTLVEQTKTYEPIVADHLKRFDPDLMMRRLQLEQPGVGARTYYLKRKTKTKVRRPTMRTLMSGVRTSVDTLLRDHGREGAISDWDTFRWLKTPHVLERLRSLVQTQLDAHVKDEEVATVSLEGGA